MSRFIIRSVRHSMDFFLTFNLGLKSPGPWVLKWGWCDRMEACKCSENVDLEAKIRVVTCVFD